MILDALTRAEHERQLEKQPDLKFVDPVKPQKNNPNPIWLWVVLGLLANVLILFLIIRAITGNDDSNINTAVQEETIINQEVVNSSPAIQSQPVTQQPVNDTFNQQANLQDKTIPNQSTDPIDSRPLAMQMSNEQIAEINRPLIYESKQNGEKSNKTVPQQASSTTSSAEKKGNVSFSSTELSADDAIPVVNKPKLLIDEGESIALNTQTKSFSNVPKLRDLPESSRNNLNQYEVNVHVFDDDPLRRFVLINMNKYKEGDRIASNGPLIEEITSEGVVIDYGNGRALLPPK